MHSPQVTLTLGPVHNNHPSKRILGELAEIF